MSKPRRVQFMKDFLEYKRDEYLSLASVSLRNYYDMLEFSYRVHNQAFDLKRDVEGNELTEEELRTVRQGIERLENEMLAVEKALQEKKEGN